MEIEDTVINVVDSFTAVEDFNRWLSQDRDFLAIDCETGGLEHWKQPLRLVQIGDVNEAWVFRADRWLGVIEETVEKYEGRWVGQNLPFDIRFLDAQGGIKFSWSKAHDTRTMAHILNPNRSTSLKSLGATFLSPQAKRLQGTLQAAMAKQGWGWADIPIDWPIYTGYAGLDCILTCRIAEKFWPEIKASYLPVYELEMQVARVCSNMEMKGCRIDIPYCEARYEEIQHYCSAVEEWCVSNYGVRPSETQQVATKLVKEGVDLSKTTATGLWSMDKDVLEGLDHPLAAAVLGHRQKTKIGSTYFANFLSMHDNGVIHTSINTLGAKTGRMSTNNPALQTLPRGSIVRDAFIPFPEEHLYSVDYAGIEARLFAHFAGEEELIKVFKEGFDPHAYAAQQVFQVEVPTKAQRQVSKSCTFALLYGAGPEKVGITAGITTEEAQVFLDTYKARFPGVAVFMKTVENTAKRRLVEDKVGWVKTPLGRRLVGEKDKLYALVNALIQGTAADVFKRALVDLDMAGFGPYMTIPVHDEILLSMPDSVNIKEVVETMEDHTSFRVPLVCEASGALDRWGSK